MEKTEYRAVKAGLMEYHLQFKTLVKKRFLWKVSIKEVWQTVPGKKAPIIGYVTQQNASDIGNAGYGFYQLKAKSADEFDWFVNKYPNIQSYFDELNKARDRWIQVQEIDNALAPIVPIKSN